MAYTPTVWKNGEFPPIDAEHLNKIEQGIANSAPGGFGLGIPGDLANGDVNKWHGNGFYSWGRIIPTNAPTMLRDDGTYQYMLELGTAEGFTQTIGCYISSSPGLIRRQAFAKSGGVQFAEWEWINPPMQIGVEYRTTERFLGNPVYVKVVDCAPLTDNKQVPHGITDVGIIFYAQGTRGASPLPLIYNHNLNDPWSCYISAVDKTNIVLRAGSSAANANSTVTLKYTKTTD